MSAVPYPETTCPACNKRPGMAPVLLRLHPAEGGVLTDVMPVLLHMCGSCYATQTGTRNAKARAVSKQAALTVELWLLDTYAQETAESVQA